MLYLEQLEVIKDIPIKEGDRKVIQCPFCHGLKKLSLSKEQGVIRWNCFRASCEGKGIYSGRRNLQATKAYLANSSNAPAKYIRPLPALTTSVDNHQPALDYLASVNSLEAHERGSLRIRYAPAENRVLFCHGHGAVGRALGGGPKWMSYGQLPHGIPVGSGDSAVLVEDVASACSVSRIDNLTGIALLGTHLTSGIKKIIKNYNKVYLVLDKDAAVKCIKESRRTSGVSVRFTSTDLKYQTTAQINKTLHSL